MHRSIHIPKPCHEDWEAMTPASQGRHCAQCCKTVIDFTGWEVDAIAAYLTLAAESRVCGRFTEDQLQQDYFIPETYLYNVFTSGLHYLKQIAAIILFVFVLTDTAGAQSGQRTKVGKTQRVLTGDVATPVPQRLAGEPVAVPQHKDTTHTVIKGRVAPKHPPVIQGAVAPKHPPVMGKMIMTPPKKK